MSNAYNLPAALLAKAKFHQRFSDGKNQTEILLTAAAAEITRLQADLVAARAVAIVESRAAYERGYRAADRDWQQAGDGMGLT